MAVAAMVRAALVAWAAVVAVPSGAQVEVTGRVVNALTGVAVPRALVNLNSRAVLTDSLGRFNFPAFTPNANGPQAYVKVTKPGYSAALDAMEALGQQPLSDVTKPFDLKLYPNSLISGVVIGSDREPLAKVQVSIFRAMGEDAQRRLMPVGSAQTNRRGEYRFDEAGGRFALTVRYSPRTSETGEVVLPQRFPEGTGSEGSTTFPVRPGEERKVDFQVKTGIAYPVTIRGDGDADGARNVRMVVRAGDGASFSVAAMPTRTPGEFRIDLPTGSYQLAAIEQLQDRRMEAEGHVTVPGKAVTGLTMHFVNLPVIPVQVIVDPTANVAVPGAGVQGGGTSGQPTPSTLNLYLKSLDESATEFGFGDVRISPLPDKSFALQAPAGTYRLAAPTGGAWFIERASYGTTDLLTQNLTVASGTGTEVVRVTVSNATGLVGGTVRQSGVAGAGFVYLIPHQPTLTPFYTAQAAGDGTYQMRVPPGAYSVVAFDHRYPGELKSAEAAGQLTGSGQTQVAAGAKASLDLELQRVEAVQ